MYPFEFIGFYDWYLCCVCSSRLNFVEFLEFLICYQDALNFIWSFIKFQTTDTEFTVSYLCSEEIKLIPEIAERCLLTASSVDWFSVIQTNAGRKNNASDKCSR